MLFNSLEFLLFLPIIFCIYWLIPREKNGLQNCWILLSSLFFYGWWDWRFLGIIVFSSSIDYFIGKTIYSSNSEKKSKLLLISSIVLNLGLLMYFKYSNFFIESFINSFSIFGNTFSLDRLNIVLPIGISFYTFQTLSYSVDIYRKKIPPEKNFITFAAYISFFPQLVAGPIERASNLLPQFNTKRKFDFVASKDALRQILWGFVKKVVIADSCAPIVNDLFSNPEYFNGSTLLLGCILFSFQIYCDFSGYSDIAIGIARLFGFKLMQNFNFPYFSRDISEFWRKWHISLSTWFRDYLYIPLGGSRGSTTNKIRNTFIIFLVSGFWHGANWTFLFWGFIHACLFLPLLLFKKNRKYLIDIKTSKFLPSFSEGIRILSTFLIVSLAWIFFRADNIQIGFTYISGIFNKSILSSPQKFPIILIIMIITFTCAEWLQRGKQHGLDFKNLSIKTLYKWPLYYFLILLVLYHSGKEQTFIYFQF